MGITFMILPKLQFCPRAPQLQETLRGRDCLQSEESSVMDETIKMTLLVKLKVYVLCLWLMSGWWHLDPVSLGVAGWLHPWLVSPGRWIWPVWGLIKEHLHEELSARIEGSSHQKSESSPFWVALGENGLFSPYITQLLLAHVWKGHPQCWQQSCCRQKDWAESSQGSAPYF